MNRLLQLWRTTTVRLTAIFVLIFVVAAILLLAFMAYQSAIVIQRQQIADIQREIGQLQRIEQRQGVRALAVAVQRLASRPGPGIYYLGDEVGRMLAGNVTGFPSNVLSEQGFHSFDYQREQAFDSNFPEPPPGGDIGGDAGNHGFALVRTIETSGGLRLVVGRDIVERRGFAAIIFQGFLFGVVGIVLLSVLLGGVTALRVLRRIDVITGTSNKIMSGNLSERIPVTRRNDEFDQLATNLNAMLDRIEQLMQGMKEVADNVAHDLKTPLTRMRNRAEAAMREGSSDEARKAALEVTITESDQLIRTFNALLMIARAEAGAPSSGMAETDLSSVMSDVAELYAPVAEDAGLELDADIEAGIKLRASRELVGQALVNLVENAIKYGAGESGGGIIMLRLARSGDRVLIEVSDQGPGIPPEDREHVVERFVRLEKSRTEPGSGLGLSLVKAVARLHGGQLRLEDNNPGLKAVLDLPAH